MRYQLNVGNVEDVRFYAVERLEFTFVSLYSMQGLLMRFETSDKAARDFAAAYHGAVSCDLLLSLVRGSVPASLAAQLEEHLSGK